MIHLLKDMAIAALPLAILLPFAILVEVVSPKDRYSLRARLPGAIYMILFPASAVLVSLPLSKLWAIMGIRPVVSIAWMHPAVQFVLLLLLFDFLRYWEHRFEHRFWWPVHSLHHSVTKLHASNGWAHPLQAIPEYLIVGIPFSLVGSSGMPIVVAMFVAFQNLVIHSPIRAHGGPLRLFYVDSRFHRLHHSLDRQHHDSNFGLVFTLWDRLFGTAIDPKQKEWPETGLATIAQPRTVFDYLVHPLKVFNTSTETAAKPVFIPIED